MRPVAAYVALWTAWLTLVTLGEHLEGEAARYVRLGRLVLIGSLAWLAILAGGLWLDGRRERVSVRAA